MTKYLVRLLESSAEVEAETVNLGQRKLWFFDQNQHLIAVFVWEKIVGFEVVGSAEEQKFTDELLHDKKATAQKQEAEIQAKGELWVTLKNALQQLGDVSSALNTTWLQSYDTRRNKETEAALLVQRHAAELRQLEAQFTDGQRTVNNRIESILTEFKELFSYQEEVNDPYRGPGDRFLGYAGPIWKPGCPWQPVVRVPLD
jgi:hypothetical protein